LEVFGFSFACRVAGFLKISNRFSKIPMGGHCFTIDYSGLAIGSNYQLQASSDLTTWTNYASAFTATTLNYTNTAYQRIEDWGKLFFRLQLVP
jgi:hypothetical protein